MTPDEIETLFTRRDGSYGFARWGRPIVPVVFGVEDDTLRVIKGAIEAVVTLAGHKMAETDPELGANLMIFFLREWSELEEVPNLDRLVPDLGPLVARLKEAEANQYRAFRFDEDGAIQAAFVFLRMDSHLSDLPAQDLALGQAAQVMLSWSESAFAARAPLARAGEQTVLRPDLADLIRAAYDPALPASANDRAHALRLYARMQAAPQGNAE
ncbi:MAG: hypothetical protein RI566_09330 [Sediminimonas sp.]|uniref:Uncharacterized protein n=1 Tax=Sediminimonas qiaohouensis TaxID=552061 RepID=A0A7C9HB79_9RHOB|nr:MULTISPECIES: hypothetical protein [Sediminimonas]MDR9485363.1 hypothetical protein [Sediminimonas sp.]MTJ04824.1 hypothetical protein [Sediminimonas qiaohouensis]